jgi:hypothetical protein
MPRNIRLFLGKAEKGSHSEHLVQRLCVCCRIIPLLYPFGFLKWGPSQSGNPSPIFANPSGGVRARLAQCSRLSPEAEVDTDAGRRPL